MLVLDGRIDNRHDLGARLELDATASDAGCVLAAYDAWGDGFAERLNGDFAVAIFDAGRKRLVLARDAIGVRPLVLLSQPTPVRIRVGDQGAARASRHHAAAG